MSKFSMKGLVTFDFFLTKFDKNFLIILFFYLLFTKFKEKAIEKKNKIL
jgi:hypothetical protein